MIRSHCDIHDIVFLCHLNAECKRSGVWRLSGCLSRIDVCGPLALLRDSIHINHIVRTWIQTLILKILMGSLVHDGLQIVLKRESLIIGFVLIISHVFLEDLLIRSHLVKPVQTDHLTYPCDIIVLGHYGKDDSGRFSSMNRKGYRLLP